MARKKKKKEPIPVDKKVEKLIEIYKDAEKKLIEIIANKKVRGNVTTFYQEMLKQVQQEILRLQIYHTQWATDITKQLYEQAYKEAIEMLGISEESLTQLHRDAIEVIADNLVNNLNQATDLVGRQIEDSIREVGLSSTANKFATGQTIRQMQKQLVIKLLDEGLTAIKDKRGRNISLSSYSEMLARSIVAETQNTCVKNVMKEHNRDLVKMTEHYTSCPLCATYEGRVYSISGNDSRFPSLQSIPGFRDGYNNIHPRCRHRISPYIEKYQDVEKDMKNSNRPFEIDKSKEESVNQYFAEQKEKAKLRNDRKQYEKYKQVLGDLAPKSFAGFRRMKKSNSDNWKELQSKYRKKIKEVEEI